MIRRTMEIPFPIPLSVIRSPSHISIALPVVMVTIAMITLYQVKCTSRSRELPKPMVIAVDSIRARPTVT